MSVPHGGDAAGSSLTLDLDLFFPCLSCVLSASTSLCCCFTNIISSSIRWSFSFSILSLSIVRTGAVAAPKEAPEEGETRRWSQRGVFSVGDSQGVGEENLGSSLMVITCSAGEQGAGLSCGIGDVTYTGSTEGKEFKNDTI